MSGFTSVFGGTTIAPANATFLALTMASDVELAWPIEQAIDGDVVADTIEVNATGPGLNIDLPDARQASTGYTAVFNNVGANTVTIRSATGANILSLTSGSAWVIYLADNSTETGTWRAFQLGAGVSVAVAAALAGSGLRAIGSTLAQDIPVTTIAVSPTTLVDTDRAKCLNWTGGLGALNLPNPAVVGNGWYVQVRNSGAGDLTVTPAAGTIDGAASKTFATGTSAIVATDGTNYITLGFGSSSGGAGGFDFVEISVAGSGDFTLSGVNLNRIAYRFTGILTGNRTIIVPNAIQQYWVANNTTGAFSLYVRTVSQAPPGIEVLQNNQSIMYCDGSDVIDAESSSVSFPVPVAQGGTGAVTAAAARTNLNVRDASITPDLTNSNVFTAALSGLNAAIRISATTPGFVWDETDAPVDNRIWLMFASGNSLYGRITNDANSITNPWLQVDRSGTTVTGITLTSTTLTLGGTLSTPGSSSSEVGYKGCPQRVQSGNYTTVLGDAGFDIVHPNGAGSGDTFTIASNAAVPYPTGTIIGFVNRDAGPLTIAIAGGDTLILANTTLSGSRALGQNGMAFAKKVEATVWLIQGVGLS